MCCCLYLLPYLHEYRLLLQPYLPEPTDYKSQWDGFYGTDQNDVNAKQQQQVEEKKEIVQDEVDIRPPQQEKRNPVKVK